MKNIGIIVDNEFNNDIRVRKEVEILKNKGYNINVLCFGYQRKNYPQVQGVNVCRIKISKKIKDVLFFLFNRIPIYEMLWKRESRKFIINNSIDILHVHDLYMSRSIYLAKKSINREIPMILDLHENFPYAIQSYNWTKGLLRKTISNPTIWLKKEALYLGYASKLIVLSESFRQKLLHKYTFINKSDIISFPNIIDLRRFEEHTIDSRILKSNKITLMYFGGVAERRGIFETIRVFRKGLANNLNIELLIIGPIDKADRSRFFQEINNPDIKDSIRHIPWIELRQLVTYMHTSDIFLSPLIKNEQHESGVANKIFQYMFGAKPIIVSDCIPQKELVESYNCGLSYSTESEYLDCITELSQNKKLRETLGLNGFQKLYAKYDNQNFDNILLDLYK